MGRPTAWTKVAQQVTNVEISDFYLTSEVITLPKHCQLCFLHVKTLTCKDFSSQKPRSYP